MDAARDGMDVGDAAVPVAVRGGDVLVEPQGREPALYRGNLVVLARRLAGGERDQPVHVGGLQTAAAG